LSTIFVTGSTGLTGGNVCRQLIERGDSVRALVRNRDEAPVLDDPPDDPYTVSKLAAWTTDSACSSTGCASWGRSDMAIDPSAILLTDRVAVVTGGGSGIGRGIAAGLVAFGAKVAIWEQNPESCTSSADAIGALGIPTDVRSSAEVDAAMVQTIEELGVPTILVNNAGGVFWSSILDTSENGWDALYKANLRHVLLCTQRVARAMVDAGVGGSIMSVTSIEGVRAAPGYAAYAAAKAGVINYTKTAALELAPHGIRVNALAPDITLTDGIRVVAPPGSEERFGFTVPMGRAGHVDEMAGAAVFLASDLASYVTGQTIHVDGGTHAAGGWYHHPETGAYSLGPTNRG